MSDRPGHDTRQRILTAALEVFAEFGFRTGTIRDIVLKARVNQAAVNYHFQGKEGLYQAVLRWTFTAHESLLPNLTVCSSALSPEAKIRSLIASLLSGVGHGDAHAQKQKLLAWELLFPTGMLERVKQTAARTHYKAICDVVRAVLPPEADDVMVSTAALWLLGQCLVFHRGADLLSNSYLAQPSRATQEAKDQTISLVTELALKGLTGWNRS